MEITSPLHSQGLILQFSYSPSIPRDFPELASQTLLLRGMSPDVPAHAVIAPFMAQARQNLACTPESEMPSIQAWRRGFARMGLKPTQYRCAAEALLRRLRKEGDLPGLHPLVDLCNAASVAFAIPVAVFDLDRVSGCLQVRPQPAVRSTRPSRARSNIPSPAKSSSPTPLAAPTPGAGATAKAATRQCANPQSTR